MRIFSALLLVSIAACGSEPDRANQTRIACAVGTADFADDCTVERMAGAEGVVLTVRHPDGGFRRLVVAADGRGVAPADGAEEATVRLIGENMIEVRIGDARYRLPATVKGSK